MAKSILIVDDEPQMLKMLRMRFEQEGFGIETAKTGESALDKIAKHHFDLVILDILLPRVDGFEVCRHIRSNPKTRNMLVLFLSAFDVSDIQTKCAEAGGDLVLLKTTDWEELLLKVKELLEISK